MSIDAASASGARPARRDQTFFALSLLSVAIAVLGFGPTYWLGLSRGTFDAPPMVHLHGWALYAWTFYFAIQSWLAASGQAVRHREWGLLGIALATIVVIFSTLAAMRMGLLRESIGLGAEGRAFMIVPLGMMAAFAVCVTLAIANVKKPEVHKRLMLAAVAATLGAPIARWFMVFAGPPGGAGVFALPSPPLEVTVLPALLGMIPAFIALGLDLVRRRKTTVSFAVAIAAIVALQVGAPVLGRTPAWDAAMVGLLSLAR